MGQVLTVDQVRARSLTSMPSPLGEAHYALHNDLAWLHAKWADYLALYGRDHATVELLNAAAPAFFCDLQRMMWEDVLLHLCRLTDPPRSCGHDNLTVRRLPDLVVDASLKDQLQNLAIEADRKSEFARDWRNRRLAHNDWALKVNAVAQPLELASRQGVEAALAAIRSVMNLVEQSYLGFPVSYEHTMVSPEGVPSLLAHLRYGVDSVRSSRQGLGGSRGT